MLDFKKMNREDVIKLVLTKIYYKCIQEDTLRDEANSRGDKEVYLVHASRYDALYEVVEMIEKLTGVEIAK